MLRAYKYRIYPTDEQKVMLAKTFGCCRYVYNWALEQREKAYWEDGENISLFEMMKRAVKHKNESAPWMKEVSARAIEFAIDDLYAGYKNFFKGIAEKPTFRLKFVRQHFHDGNLHGCGVHADFKRGLMTIPKIKNIPCVFHRRFTGRIKQVAVELLPSGRYNISILVDDGHAAPEKAPIDPERTLGIDTGLKHFAQLSDGQTYEPTHEAKKEKRKLKLLQRRLSKKEKGSRQFRILKQRIAKLHEKVANRRHDRINKITHYLAYENQATTICVEDLNIEGMKHNKHLAYNVNDACLGLFYRKLKYKCEWAGKNYIEIDRWAPSSKRCSHCGHIYKTLKLNKRKWTCPACGTHHDRDLNAAINIKHFGLSEQQTLPSVRREVKPVEQPLVDDRSSEPKKLCSCGPARRVRARKQPTCCATSQRVCEVETGKVKGKRAPMPSISQSKSSESGYRDKVVTTNFKIISKSKGTKEVKPKPTT